MPSSHHYQLNDIIEIIMLTNPGKLLDIGIGFGKYGLLAREYLDLWKEGADYQNRTVQIDGIEAFEPYITPVHKFIYDNIFIGNALEILPGLRDRYDLVLLIDVFEHFSYDDGRKLLEQCRKASKNILISVPLLMSEQEAVFGNPYEEHMYAWKKKDLRHIPDKFFITNMKSLICFIGEDSSRVRDLLKKRRFRTRIIRLLDFLHVKRLLKQVVG